MVTYKLFLVAVCLLVSSNLLISTKAYEPITLTRNERRLVTTERGLQVENSWIAVVKGNEARCDEVKEEIRILKSEMEGLSANSDNFEQARIKKCYVTFTASEGLAKAVKQLIKDVIVVKPNNYVNIVRDSAPMSWGLDRIDQSDMPLSRSPFQVSHTGAGVNVYIVDTGVNCDHVEYKGRCEYGKDFVNENIEADLNGHGSHCAGTAVGNEAGIATNANLIGVKVLSASGSGSTSGVISGLAWAVKNQKDRHKRETAVISMSLGGGKNSAMDDAVEDASDEGMIVVVAAGNNNRDACNYSPAAAGGKGDRGGVISVGSTDSRDSRSSFSNFGGCTDIYAPGSNIKSAWKGSPKAYNTISGTSMACPHVAGVAAVLLEKHGKDKGAAVSELFNIAVRDRISNLIDGGKNSKSPNLLLQVPIYTGPPTPPTNKPTPFPTYRPDELCVNGKVCARDYREALFGPRLPSDALVKGRLMVPAGDQYGCSAPSSGSYYAGAIVLVDRGNCLFFEKVKNAENGGAVAVIIALTANGAPFPPNYYGDETVSIPSVMIGFADARKFKSQTGRIAHIGSPDMTAAPTTSDGVPGGLPPPGQTPPPTKARKTRKPTFSPTIRPTKAPTTGKPTRSPTPRPTKSPTTPRPTKSPTTARPTRSPTPRPTKSPTTARPTRSPTTGKPTRSPTPRPTQSPSTPRPTKAPVTPKPTRPRGI